MHNPVGYSIPTPSDTTVPESGPILPAKSIKNLCYLHYHIRIRAPERGTGKHFSVYYEPLEKFHTDLL